VAVKPVVSPQLARAALSYTLVLPRLMPNAFGRWQYRERVVQERSGAQPQQENLMKKLMTALSLLAFAGFAVAQVGTAVKETGKATAETAKQATENTKAAVSDQPEKTVHKAKAKVHKAKAKQHRANAKEAAKETVN
jgi:hypothetical protein